MSPVPSYSVVNTEEVAKLASLNASGSVFAVYSILCAYARRSKSCFPSIKTIMECLGQSYHRTTIQKALKFLEDNKLIKRNSRRSKSRFQMLFRAAVQQVKQLINNSHGECSEVTTKECSQSASRRKHERRKSYKHKKSKSRFHYQTPPPNREDIKAERMGQFIMNGVISNGLHSSLTPDDWNWLEQYHPAKAKTLANMNI